MVLCHHYLESNLDFLIFDLTSFSPIIGNWLTPQGKIDPEVYLALITMHGTIMVFFVLTAGLSGTFSNYLIPLQIGARDMASGFLNMLSYWFFFLSSIIMFISIFVEGGPASGGWTIYPPLSALPQAVSGSGMGMTLWLVSMAFFIVSALLGALNYITTVINLRTEGMTFFQNASYDLGIFSYRYPRCTIFSCSIISSFVTYNGSFIWHKFLSF